MATTDPLTYKLNHTMLRVKDPKQSLKFYQFLGFSLVEQLDFPDNLFSLYFLAYGGSLQGNCHWTDRNAVLELTHNHGTETDPHFRIANGNTEPHLGFGHIAVAVDNIEDACQRLENAECLFQKNLIEDRNRQIAVVTDPDGYWVMIIRRYPQDVASPTAPSTYRLNHTMIRVKSAEVSLKWYQEVLGMTLVRTIKDPDAKFDLYFLGYPGSNPPIQENASNPVAEWEGLLELTWHYGTENREGQVYHDGNSEPEGFSHICVSVDDLEAACARLEALKVTFKKRITDGMSMMAFISDPDGYWIEIIQNKALQV